MSRTHSSSPLPLWVPSQHTRERSLNQMSLRRFSFLKNILYWLFYYSCLYFFLPVIPLLPAGPPTSIPLPSLVTPWVVHRSSLASCFPILFLTSSCLFCTYHLCYLFSVPFPPLFPSHSPAGNLPCDLHFCDSVPVLVVCLVFVSVF